MRPLNIGIYGSAVSDEGPKINAIAYRLGERIAKDGHTLITGACKGIPYEANKGANAHNGQSIGFTCVTSVQDHERYLETSPDDFTQLITIPEDYPYKHDMLICKKYRNVSSVAMTDIALFISGRWGTLNEFSIAFDTGKIMGLLTSYGKFSSQALSLVTFFEKKTTGVILTNSDPDLLYENVVRVAYERSVERV